MEKKRKNMVMTDAEIVRSWKEAKDRNAQVRILVELNVCSRDKIIEILKDNGIDGRQLPRKKKAAPFVLSDKPEGAVDAAVSEGEAVCEITETPAAVESRIEVVDPCEGIVAEALEYYRADLVKTVAKLKAEYEAIVADYAAKISDIDMKLAGVREA